MGRALLEGEVVVDFNSASVKLRFPERDCEFSPVIRTVTNGSARNSCEREL